MALPIPSKKITSALVKTGDDAKKEDKKISSEKLLPGSTDKNKVKVSKFGSRKPKTYSKKFKTSKFLPPSKIDKQFDLKKLDDLLTSLVDNTKDLKNATKKDVDDENKKNIQKVNVKSKVKRNKREENAEEKKQVVKVSKPVKFKAPDFLKDILGMAGRLVLATGIMSILNYLTDPEKKDGLIQFLTDHIDKIVLGTLAILGATFVASFLPVIGMVGTLLAILSPIIMSLVGVLVSLPVIAALTLSAIVGSAYVAPKLFPDLVNEQERKIDQAPGTREEKIKLLEKQLEELSWFDKNVRGMGPEIEEQLHRLRTGKTKSYGTDVGQSGDDLYRGDDKRKESSTEVQEPIVKPQTKVLPGGSLGGLQGHSGSVAYAGQKRAPLSTEYSPLAQSDIDEQNLSIISGMGYREISGRDHKGYDIPAEEGTPISAYFPGVILRNMPNVKGYGNLIEWKDDVYGETHMFAHMMEPSTLSPGTKFKKGTVLGKIGNTDGGTGMSEGPHLHWEIGPDKGQVEPGEWVRKHPQIKVSPNQPKSNQDQNVSSKASYEQTGVQVAMVEKAVPVPVGGGPGNGGGGFTGGSSGDVNNTLENLVLTTHYREA